MRIPIACTLEGDAPRERVDRWRDVLAAAVARKERVAPDRLALELHGDLAELRALTVLARDEKACCDFFTFSFEIEAEAVTLIVAVPDDAVALLDDFATLTDPA